MYQFGLSGLTILPGSCNEAVVSKILYILLILTICCLFAASCPDPGVPAHGQRVGSSFGHGKHLQFICDSGYWLVGSQLIVCNEGNWSNDIPKCKGT